MNWKKLQNGSDIRGVALEGVVGETVNLTPEVAAVLGKSFVQWLQNFTSQTNISIAVGADSRISGPILKSAFIAGILEAGASVYDCGLASTPAMFMTTVSGERATTAGVMITASHLPFNRNGFKFFTNKGGLDKKDITEILRIAEDNEYPSNGKELQVENWNFIDEYSSFLVDYIRKNANIMSNHEQPLQGLKIIVDAGNGAGGFFAKKVLNQLGADTRGSQFLNPDGNFPNHVPNPEDKDAMQSICDAVVREKADLGVIFDTDVDRSAIVDSEGNPVNRNSLIALISAVILAEHPGSTIVTDSITSDGLTKFIELELKGKHHRFQRGYKNVINESIRLNTLGEESWLAIETSGHAALKENYFLDDGAYLVAKLLVEMAKLNAKGRKLTDLISKLEQPIASKEIRLTITEEDFGNYGKRVLAELEKKVNQMDGWEVVSPNYEGLRVRCSSENEKGWFLLRLSLHDPVMPLNIESDVVGGIEIITIKLQRLLQDFHF
ncbi:MAG: phosphomannomutase/phosphoglucomutase [Porphyromonadaceae bacterium CG2_30_38_12]|nr:MAG: phosphomannomutase/phosphoglucomutase [Porphyromonadaceae bacterium CG2_30_38_12]